MAAKPLIGLTQADTGALTAAQQAFAVGAIDTDKGQQRLVACECQVIGLIGLLRQYCSLLLTLGAGPGQSNRLLETRLKEAVQITDIARCGASFLIPLQQPSQSPAQVIQLERLGDQVGNAGGAGIEHQLTVDAGGDQHAQTAWGAPCDLSGQIQTTAVTELQIGDQQINAVAAQVVDGADSTIKQVGFDAAQIAQDGTQQFRNPGVLLDDNCFQWLPAPALQIRSRPDSLAS